MNVDLFEMKTEDLKSNQNLILNDSDNFLFLIDSEESLRTHGDQTVISLTHQTMNVRPPQ